MKPALFTTVLLVLGLTAIGCTPTAITVARRSITAADRAQIAGAEAFAAFDAAHQRALLDANPPEDARARLDAYRATRARVVSAYKLLADASHAARAVVDAIEAGQGGDADLASALRALTSAAQALHDAGNLIGFKVPGLDPLLATAGGAP